MLDGQTDHINQDLSVKYSLENENKMVCVGDLGPFHIG